MGQEAEVWARQWARREASAAEEPGFEELMVVEMLDALAARSRPHPTLTSTPDAR